MPIYHVYSDGASHEIKYRFKCGHCGETTDWIPYRVDGSGTIQKKGTYDAQQVQEQVSAGAVADVQNRINVIKEFTSKGHRFKSPFWNGTERSYSFDSRCPSCNKTHGSRNARYFLSSLLITGLVFIVIAIVGAFAGLKSGSPLEVVAVLLMVALFLFLFLRKSMRRKRILKNAVVEYDWCGK